LASLGLSLLGQKKYADAEPLLQMYEACARAYLGKVEGQRR
jgi:hypothetical protein